MIGKVSKDGKIAMSWNAYPTGGESKRQGLHNTNSCSTSFLYLALGLGCRYNQGITILLFCQSSEYVLIFRLAVRFFLYITIHDAAVSEDEDQG
ncbi:predicted protein [Plenodomus lingam JN3]|uniref:Predicted protein n=1 Tax=Leptosphaeria maculans (strain JN3 / isolate v23.1.3 / race Av1-4-5-6-7-8) TaxID=985895 RepID=E4ZLM5_LEPMJ|nr:predicted protein [Plenodomus lingam JN3]CBX92705.1 predicted protein [Plenodomus lingam JN3]